MLNLLHTLLALIPTRPNENEISLPEVWKQALMVRRRRRCSGAEVPVWADTLSVPRSGRRDYYNALRSASAGCNPAIEGDQDLQVLACGTKRPPKYYTDGRDCGAGWIERKRNSIACRHIDGQGIARAG